MKTYTFYLHEGAETIPAFEIEQFVTRNEALAHAHRLLTLRQRYDRVVVTEEVIEIARLDRPEAAAEAHATAPH